MLKLKLTGIHEDGDMLLLEAADGSTYLLPIDQNLRQSIARAKRITPQRSSLTGNFGPREIQNRFRQGATVEEIAAESGWEPERVRRYEWPIVAERANIIRTAQASRLSPAPGQQGPSGRLLDLFQEVARAYGFAEAAQDWNTWQQESGQWTVTLDLAMTPELAATLPSGLSFPARWTFNPANQGLYASNEAAYFVMGQPLTGQGSKPASLENLQAQPAEEQQQTEPEEAQPATSQLEAETHQTQREQEQLQAARSFDPASERKLADLLERARRSGKQVAEPQQVEAPQAALAEAADSLSSETSQEQAEVEVPEVPQEADLPALQEEKEEKQLAVEEKDSQLPERAQAEPQAVSDQETADAQAQEAKPAARPSTSGRRTSVPSWDDIIFGNQRR